MKQLRLNRCSSSIPLIYEFYGTGHIIYKNFMFYQHNEAREIIAYNIIDKTGINIIPVPINAICCESKDSIYKMKHSGFFDFEADENGLWMIYRGISLASKSQVYVIAKIDESEYATLKIEKIWNVNVDRETTLNLFISCGQLYAIKQQLPSMVVTISKICNLLEDESCIQDYSKNDVIILNTLTSQIAFVQYNSDRKMLSIVDGGNLLYFKFNVSFD